MKKMEQWKEELVTSLEVPRDLAMKETVVTITGLQQAVVCNYRSILCYQSEEILLLTFCGKLRIRGKRLTIPSYTPEEMHIEGRISEVVLER
ncbi:YabP/YqfC family sporulation protein [Blautia sp. MSJ-19]|uniref:YabP/YqfC family sporulation protein n=1 Tax=Blautia sp. MSJ-19 TaxID=2841517 RepID=UPI001C0EF505|nr:YabP/YqfC family sporulation protein [Blautia sp. MSJ-19]MBU5481526.1 YabP/YqfC family sporulation protein [Blautia sp. MSJ-19]